MTWIIAIAGLVSLAGTLRWFKSAMRGRLTGDQPCCRRCGYQPGTKTEDPTTCPECGHAGAMVLGFRSRSKPMVAAASFCLILSLTAVCWPVLAPRIPTNAAAVYAALPDWIIVQLVSTGSATSADEASNRLFEDSLSRAAEHRLIDNLIALQADRNRPLDAAWSDGLLLAFARGRMTPEQAEDFIRSTVEVSFDAREIVVQGSTNQRYRVRVTGRYPNRRPPDVRSAARDTAAQLAAEDIRTRSRRFVQIERVTANGEPAPNGRIDGDAEWMPFGSGPSFGGRVPVPQGEVAENGWSITMSATIAVTLDGKQLTSWQTTRSADARFARAGETPIPIIRDEETLAAVVGSISGIQLEVEPVPDTRGRTIGRSGDTLARFNLGLPARSNTR